MNEPNDLIYGVHPVAEALKTRSARSIAEGLEECR
jgi:hypothetical protein